MAMLWAATAMTAVDDNFPTTGDGRASRNYGIIWQSSRLNAGEDQTSGGGGGEIPLTTGVGTPFYRNTANISNAKTAQG